MESIRHATVVERARPPLRGFPVRPVGCGEALALARPDGEGSGTSTRRAGADAVSSQANNALGATPAGACIVDYRVTESGWSVENAFRHHRARRGKNGWYFGISGDGAGGWTPWWAAWGLRAADGTPNRMRVGDALDYWRVELIEPGRRLRPPGDE
ncbi:MAG: hypothetical protein IPL30_07935 [Elusimicrobia bacterium]|nr:hypothetical protein [Elusimicrobiota bacterium]